MRWSRPSQSAPLHRKPGPKSKGLWAPEAQGTSQPHPQRPGTLRGSLGYASWDRKSRLQELRNATRAPRGTGGPDSELGQKGYSALTFNQEHPKVEEPGRVRGRVSFQQWPGGRQQPREGVVSEGWEGLWGGRMGGRTRPVGLRTGNQPKCSGPDRGRGLWTEGLCIQGGRVDERQPWPQPPPDSPESVLRGHLLLRGADTASPRGGQRLQDIWTEPVRDRGPS